ncbi:DUF3037 domain-containing protein [uncultured Clostridium sp.]|uniref:DUF3037 domain-containing protein n=1 Tax=uncultured Clostridium sp. TaxID=59620 RepID=UPI002628FBEC|nr:DUF3037 domain-containing protein [uncultured Clostridium sp.]
MNVQKKKILYSVIRYTSDIVKGEILNVGLIFHNVGDSEVKYFLLNEKSPKLKCIFTSETEMNIYRTNREVIEEYLKKNAKDMSGIVGAISIDSYYSEKFLYKLCEYSNEEKMLFSEPNIVYTKDCNKLFTVVLNKYVGEKYINKKEQTITAKKYLKEVFIKNENLKKKVKIDLKIKPILELEELDLKIDFTFKNDKWNYIQTVPFVKSKIENIEWFSETKMLLDAKSENAKIHLVYKNSELIEDEATHNLLKYLKDKYCNLVLHNIEEKKEIIDLCNIIEKEGVNFTENNENFDEVV